ncbi:MAG: TolC family protein [Deltaproteobacteria bacterium]
MILGLLLAAQTVSMDALVTEALAKNEDAETAKLVVERAEAQRREAWADLFGAVSVSGTYRRRAFQVSFPGEDGEERFINRLNALSAQARAELTVFDAPALARLSKSGADVGAAEAKNVELRRTLAFEVADLYVTVLAGERARAAAERRLELAQETFDNVNARFEAGLTAKNVLNRAKLEVATAKLEATRADNAARQLRLSLGFVVGRAVDGQLEEPDQAAPTGGEAELLATATEARPDLETLRRELEANRIAAREPWYGLLPTVGVAAEASLTNETGFQQRVANWSLSATAEWLLWDGGARYAIARQRAADTRESELALSKQLRRVKLELSQARTDLNTAQAAVAQAEARLEVARENAEEVRARFTQGLASALEQADAAVAEYDAAQALAAERFEASAAALRLTRAVGDWPTEAR